MNTETDDIIKRLDARITDTDAALLVSCKNEIKRLHNKFFEADKLLYEIYNSGADIGDRLTSKLKLYVDMVEI
jgi:hypothetical protein